MATKEKLYRKFGPKLIEAVVRVQMKESNLIRERVGLPLLTAQQVVNAIDNELQNIPDYLWMNEEI